MILFTDFRSILEAHYLGDKLVNEPSDANIIVNPDNYYYQNKIIIITDTNYDLSILSELSKYNKIKSRIKLNNAKFNYTLVPYRNDRLMNITFNVYSETGYNYEVTKDNHNNIILYTDEKGNLATILPKYNSNDISISSGISSYEMYLKTIKNSIKDE